MTADNGMVPTAIAVLAMIAAGALLLRRFLLPRLSRTGRFLLDLVVALIP